jgi:ATP synthase F1 delta subunit
MDQTQKIVRDLIRFLKTTNKIDSLSEIIDLLVKEEERLKGENIAVITSAIPLEKEKLSQLQKQLLTVFKRKLEIVNKVDPDVIGGFVIQVSDKIIDLSIDSYLSEIEKNLKNEKN